MTPAPQSLADHPSGTKGQVNKLRRMMVEPYDLLVLALRGFRLPWDPPPALFPVLPFGRGRSVPSLSPLCVLEALACLDSQVHSWRTVLPRDEMNQEYLASHPELTKCYPDETLDFRLSVDAGTS